MKSASSDLVYLMEDQIEVICSKDYYEVKQNSDFSFSRMVIHDKN